MKKLLIISALIIVLCSCHPDKVITNESASFNTTDSAMMIQAKDLNGFAGFKILKTTEKDLKSILKRQSEKNVYIDSDEKPNFRIGYFSSEYEEANFIEESKIIKQYYLSKYYFGEVEINQISLFFYKDTLVGIHINLCEEEIIGMLVMKYGEGQGNMQKFCVEKWDNSTSKYNFHLNSFEKRKWKNDRIEANYDYSISDGRMGYYSNSLIILDITGSFKAFEEEYKRLKSVYKNRKANEYQKTLKNI